MPRFAANLSMLFTEVPFAERFSAAARAGFSAVEFHFPYADPAPEVAAWAQAAGVEVALFNLPPGDWAAGERGLAALPGREAEFMAGLERALVYAEALAVPCLHVMAGVVPDGADPQLYRQTLLANLRQAAPLAARAGRTLLLEAINRHDMPGYFVDSPQAVALLCAEVGAPNVKLLFDLYHVRRLGGDGGATLDAVWPWLGHVQIAGVPARDEPAVDDVATRAVLAELDRRGYAGWVGCEYRPRTTTDAGLGWLQAYSGHSGHSGRSGHPDHSGTR